MQLVFIYGPVASGKYTIGTALAARTGFKLFHNHLIVDAVAAVFAFGSDAFVRLREEFWLATFREAAAQDQSLIFTFAPEPTVAADFPRRVERLVAAAGGAVQFVHLTVPRDAQEQRLVEEGRAKFGKLRSLELLRQLRDEFDACEAAMPAAQITIDTATVAPEAAARAIADALGLRAH
jgi:hypothetical protein